MISFKTGALTFDLLRKTDLSVLDKQFMDGEFWRPQWAAQIQALPENDVKLWALYNARYGLPTIELFDWLKAAMGDPANVLEIGAGMGDLGRNLGIRQTDSYIQTTPEVRAFYEATNQPIISPPSFVEKIEANEAVAKYKPRVVIASWVTQHWSPLDPEGTGGSVYGPDEEDILRNVEIYIHIGNMNTHGDKRILKREHKVLFPDWVCSRASDPLKNCIHIWSKQK